jgi:hypothetical protein
MLRAGLLAAGCWRSVTLQRVTVGSWASRLNDPLLLVQPEMNDKSGIEYERMYTKSRIGHDASHWRRRFSSIPVYISLVENLVKVELACSDWPVHPTHILRNPEAAKRELLTKNSSHLLIATTSGPVRILSRRYEANIAARTCKNCQQI